MKYGRSLVRRFGNDKEQYGYIRGKMRQLERLLICLHQLSGKKVSLRDVVHPSMFQMVVRAAQECAGFDDALSSYHIWSTTEQVAEVKLAQALERCDTDTAEIN